MIKKSILSFLLPALLLSYGHGDNRYSKNYKDEVSKQHADDIKNRDRILAELNAFIGESDKAVSEEGLDFNRPVAEENITDIKSTEEFHTGGIILPDIYGYVNTETLNMRSQEGTSSDITGKLKFRERIVILYQSDKTDTIKEVKSPWLLVRRSNGDEGWVFGAYISDDMPSAPDRDYGKTDWNMIMPVSGRISSRFGYRVDPVTKRRNTFHKGIDIAAPAGTPVYAAEDGTVIKAEFVKSGYGNLIIIKHSNDVATYYGHLSGFEVRNGKKVRKGELIARVGSTGKSTGPHLHFEVRKGKEAMNPEEYIR